MCPPRRPTLSSHIASGKIGSRASHGAIVDLESVTGRGPLLRVHISVILALFMFGSQSVSFHSALLPYSSAPYHYPPCNIVPS